MTAERLASAEERAILAEEIAARGKQIAASLEHTAVDTRKVFTDATYKSGFRGAHPAEDIGQVHHTIERQLRDTGLFTESEIQALASLRGIPRGASGLRLHQGVIRMVYDSVYNSAKASGSGLTRADVLGAAEAIDEYLGHLFVPPVP